MAFPAFSEQTDSVIQSPIYGSRVNEERGSRVPQAARPSLLEKIDTRFHIWG